MDLSIIIVNWNSMAYVRRCVDSILAGTGDLDFDVTVIDAASFDGCGEMLRNEFPGVRFIQCHENLGFAKSNNLAARGSRGEALLFLNPDTEVIGSAIGTLCRALKDLPDAGAVGGTLLNSDGSVQTSCIQAFPTILNQLLSSEYLRRRWPRSRLWGMAPLFENASHPREVEAISGACLLTTRAAFERVGGFSGDYFMYAEDIDLSYKLRTAGYRNYYIAAARVVHHGGNSTRQAASQFAAVMMRDSVWRFMQKRQGNAYGRAYRITTWGAAVGRLLLVYSVLLTGRESPEACRATRDKWRAVLRWSRDPRGAVEALRPGKAGRAVSGGIGGSGLRKAMRNT